MTRETGGALVIGGSGGLGAAIVRRLAQDWEHVAFTYRSNRAAAEAMLGEPEIGARLQAHALDLTDDAALAGVLEAAHRQTGGLRAVVWAAGVHIPQKYVSAVEPADWQAVLTTELSGFIALIRHALPILRETRGALVAIGSVAPHRHIVGDVLSAVPKAGIETLCRAIAREEGRYGVRANSVAPGIMEVGIGGELMRTIYDAAIWEQSRKNTPLRRFGRGEDVAGAAAFLCSSEAGFITGQTLIVDGGLSV